MNIRNIFKGCGFNKKERIQEWIDWCDIPIEIVTPSPWGIDRPWAGEYDAKNKWIRIDGGQSEKEIIKSIVHEVCHWKNDDRPDDVDIWVREERAIRCEKQWKKNPDEVIWNV